MADYIKRVIDLATPRSTPELVEGSRNGGVYTVVVIGLPTGASVRLHIGEGKDDWPLKNQGMQFKMCRLERDGIFVSNPAAGAGELILGITFAPTPVEVTR